MPRFKKTVVSPFLFKESDKLVAKWSSLPGEEHVPVARYMTDFSFKLALFSQFGSHAFTDEEILDIRHYYDIVCVYLNLRKLQM